jgi:hypothetical protein
LTNYYKGGSVKDRNKANNVQDDFMKTLNQMESEDVPAQVIEDYKKAEILRKSMAVIKQHAKKLDDIRKSPERYDKVKGKIKTSNPFAINVSSVVDNTKRTIGSTMTHGKREPTPSIKEDAPAFGTRARSPRVKAATNANN